MTPKWVPKSDPLSGEMPLGAPLVVQTVFVIKKWAPSAPKVLPIEKITKNDTKELPECEKELKKWICLDPGPADCAKRLQ